MKRPSMFLIPIGIALLAAGCGVPRSEFDAHVAAFDALRAEHELLESDLQTWAGQVRDWSNGTYNTICDIVAKNGPAAKYAQTTIQYCPAGGQDGAGKPPDPPDFGG